MIREGTIKLVDGNDLTAQETTDIMNEVMSGRATNIETASFLTALQAKGATIEEITACAEVMRKHADAFKGDGDLLEIVGTGGDKSFTFNISTTAAVVAAAGGCRVAKHGNRAATSKSGAADVLEAAGAVIDLDGKQCRKVLDETGFCFLFARSFHKAMKYVAPVRQELSIPTVFNLLGPLTNPAGATVQVLGVYKEELLEPMARILYNLGVQKGIVAYGMDGMDEISASAPTKICEFSNGRFTTSLIRPEDFGLIRGEKADLIGSTPQENATIMRRILSGEEKGAKRTAIVLNAGAALYADRKAACLAGGIELAGKILDEKKGLHVLNEYIAATHRV